MALHFLILGLIFFVSRTYSAGENIYNISYGDFRPIYVDIELLSLTSIDGASQTFTADFFMSEAYQDNTHNVTTGPEEELGSSAVYDRVEMEFVNSQDAAEQYRFAYASVEKPTLVNQYSSVQEVAGIPWIRVETRVQGTFKVGLQLQDFPFDHQVIRMELESSNHPIEQGVFLLNTQSDMLSIMEPLVEWEVEGSFKNTTTTYYNLFNETYSRADFSIYLKRIPTFFLDKVVSGVAMLVVMSWCLFTLDTMDSNRHATAATTFLAVVTYLFILSGDVPKVSYTTRIGNFVNLSLFEIFFTYVLFCVTIGITRQADSALEAAKDERKKKRKQQRNAGGGGEVPLEDEAEEDEEDPEGWWDTWKSVRPALELGVVTILITVFVVVSPILLRHTGGAEIPAYPA